MDHGDVDLVARLRDAEDRFVERKPAAAGRSDFKRTIVAFANSVPENRVGILYIGIGDDRAIHGVPNPDRMQRDVRQTAENDCYPSIFVDSEVLRIEDKLVVAILVRHSTQRPHFAGPAYVRRGSESLNASEAEYEELVNSRLSVVRQLQEWKGQTVTVTEVSKQLGQYFPLDASHHKSDTFVIVDVNSHCVRFKRLGSGRFVTEIVQALRLSWDDEQQRPRVLAFPVRHAGA
jgi:hypothetical protein